MLHYSVSIRRHVERCKAEGQKLTAGQVAILWALWAEVRNPFADTPSVWASYEHLAGQTGLSAEMVRKHAAALKNAGCLRKGKSVRGRGTEYTLLRPKHAPDDVKRNPFAIEGEVVVRVPMVVNLGNGVVVPVLDPLDAAASEGQRPPAPDDGPEPKT